ncbi:MAG: hypothetical protein ISS48_00435 [Candidatus Aenigmarchaeota archaeon]|nr:hypothetical protein [Candidatus Aenigmarchaeota archaeon]
MKIKNFQEVKIKEFLPETTKIFVPKEQRNVVENCVRGFGSEQNLANHLGISRSRVNDWKFERSRIDMGYFVKMKEMLKEEITAEFQFQTHKRNGLNVCNFEMTPKISWLIGIRDGDRDEDEYCIGVGTSDPEIATEFIEILESVFKLRRNELHCQITVPKYSINEKEKQTTKIEYSRILDLPKNIIRVYPKDKQGKHKRYHITKRYYNKLIKAFFNNFERWFKENITSFDDYVQGGYVKGLIDSEGTVRDYKRVAIEMRPSPIINFLDKVLDNLKLEHKFFEYKKKNVQTIVIYGPIDKIIKLSCPIHNNKREKLLKHPTFLV